MTLTESDADELSAAAWSIYNDKLKAILVPHFVGQVVAILPPSGDYEVARNSPKAWKPLRQRHPDGQYVVIDIGPVSEHNALTLRNSGFGTKISL